MPNAVLIDGSYLLHRSMNHPVYKKFKTTTGLPTGGVFGFCSTLQKLVKKYGANMAVAWEGGGTSRKREIDASYKANRPGMVHQETTPIDWHGPLIAPRELTPDNTFQLQKHLVQTILRFLNISNGFSEGNEADDVLAAWAKRLHTHDDISQIIIYTLDHDLWQCVTHKCSIYYPGSQAKDERVVTLAEIEAKHGSADGVRWDKVLRGDGSDNVPAVQFLFPSAAGHDKLQPLPPRMMAAVLQTRPRSLNELLDVLSPKSDSDPRCSPLFGYPAFKFGPDTMDRIRKNMELISLKEDCVIQEVPPVEYLSRLKGLPHVFAALEFKKFGKQGEVWQGIAQAPKSKFLAGP